MSFQEKGMVNEPRNIRAVWLRWSEKFRPGNRIESATIFPAMAFGVPVHKHELTRFIVSRCWNIYPTGFSIFRPSHQKESIVNAVFVLIDE
jgi:hypothetical protein